MKKIISIVGTRADIIKMSVLIYELNKSKKFHHIVLYSNQHQEMGMKKLSEFKLGNFLIAKYTNCCSSNDLSRLSFGINKEIKK